MPWPVLPAAERGGHPIAMAKREALPRRFYKEAVATKGEVSSCCLMAAQLSPRAATIWRAGAGKRMGGGGRNYPAVPLMRLVNSAIDDVAPRLAVTVEEIAKYAGSDLVCYRAGEPQALA